MIWYADAVTSQLGDERPFFSPGVSLLPGAECNQG
jgi:hypothetical protein